MEDSEIVSKRRKLDPPEGELNGHNVRNTFFFDKESTAQKTKSHKPNHKGIRWNFKLVRPEVLKCCRSIVKDLNRTGPAGERSNENETEPLQQNGLTPSREDEKESAFTPKRKLSLDCVKQGVYKEGASAACLLPTNCSALVTVAREISESSKENKNGCNVTNQAPNQQRSLESIIPSTLTKDKVRDEIRKTIKDRTREAMDKVESLKSRISTLENENHWLKHKVTILLSALKKEIGHRKQKEVLLTTLTNSTLQNKPNVKPHEGDCLESLLQPQPKFEAAIKDKTKDGAFQVFKRAITTDTSDSLRFGSEAVDKIHQKRLPPLTVESGLQIRAPNNIITPSAEQKIINNQTTRSVGTGSHSPIAALGKETTLSFVHLPNHFPEFSRNQVQNAFGPPTKTTLYNGNFSSAAASQPQLANISSNGSISKSTPNPVSLLCQVLDEILETSTKELPDQFTLNPLCGLEAPRLSKNFHEPFSCSITGKTLAETISNENEGVLSKQPTFPLKRKISTNTQTEKTSQGNKKKLLDQHRAAEYLSPITPDYDASKEESKHGKLLGNTCIVENGGKKEVSPMTSNGTSHYKSQTQPHLPDSQVQSSNATLLSPSASPDRSILQPEKPTPITSPGSPSVLSSSGQSVGPLDGINMLAQAAGLGNTTTKPILCSEKSSKNQTPPLDRAALRESITIHNQDLSQYGLNNYAVQKPNTPLHITSEAYSSKSQSHPLSVRQHISTDGSLKGDCVKEKTLDKTDLLKPYIPVNHPLQQDERATSQLHQDSNISVTERFSNCNPGLAAVSPNNNQTMPYHAKPEKDHSLLAPPKFYNDRKCKEHTLRQAQNSTWVRNPVISEARYFPYSPIRPEVQQPFFTPVRSNIQYVPKVSKRQSPKPHGLTPPTTGDIARWPYKEKTSTKGSNIELFLQQPRFSRSPEISLSKARLAAPCSSKTNTSSNYDEESLLGQLLDSDRAPYIPHYSSTTYSNGSSRVTQGFSNAQTLNALKLPSKSSETRERYFYLHPKNHVHHSIQNSKESSICNGGKTKSEGISLPSKPPLSVGESHKEGSWQTPVCSAFNCVSFHPTPTLNPQIELSHPCQRYLTQLRKSPSLFSHENSIYSTVKLKPLTESEATDGNNSSQQSLKFPISYCSIKRQATCRQEGCDANPPAPSTQNRKDNNNLPQNQRPHVVLYHHKKITNPQQQQ